jgi:hypothetical protein
VKKIVIAYVVSVVPEFLAVPLAVQPPSEAAHLVTTIALRLSTSLMMAVAGGKVFWVRAGAEEDADALTLGDGLALWLDLEQPAKLATARATATGPTIRVVSWGGRMVVTIFHSGSWIAMYHAMSNRIGAGVE